MADPSGDCDLRSTVGTYSLRALHWFYRESQIL